MEPYIIITAINDFLYCPKTLYEHLAADQLSPETYHSVPQVRGNAMHDAIDKKQYSTRKAILQGKSIYCEELGIAGKLDTFDTTSGELVERKALIKDIYEGYKMQLYAEYYCLKEMGYKPTKLAFYSMTDNRKYSLPIPKLPDKKRLAQILDEMRSFTLDDLRKHCCPHCKNSIYNALDW